MNTRIPSPSSNGQHDPAELERKRLMRDLRKKAHSSLYLWFGVTFGLILFFSLFALVLAIVAISR